MKPIDLAGAAAAARPQAPPEQAGRSADADRRQQELRKAAEEFEAVFLNELLKAMRSTVPTNDLLNSQGATKFYQQMHDAEMAKVLATGPTRTGIADLIVKQLSTAGQAQPAAVGAGDRAQAQASAPAATAPAEPGAVDPDRAAGLERYRALGEQTRELARRSLRRLAEAQGSATADTLARFEEPIRAAAADSGLDPGLILAVVMEESGGDPLARSPRGAVGLMQLMPATAREVGVQDPTDPRQCVAGGARYLARMLERYGGDLELALAAYNAGPGNVDKAGGRVPAFRETREYVGRVTRRYGGLAGGTNLATGGR